MTRTFALVRWTLKPDRDDDAPPLTHRFRCLSLKEDDTECGAESDRHADARDAQPWAFEHLRDHPAHTSYAEVIERPWVMWGGDRS